MGALTPGTALMLAGLIFCFAGLGLWIAAGRTPTRATAAQEAARSDEVVVPPASRGPSRPIAPPRPAIEARPILSHRTSPRTVYLPDGTVLTQDKTR